MKVLLITHKYWPEIGGTATLAERMTNALCRAGHHVTVLTRVSPETGAAACRNTFLKASGIPVLHVLITAIRAWLSERAERFDHIILNDLPAAKSAALFFSRSMLRKTIVIVHGSEPENVFVAPTLITRATCFQYSYRRLLARCRRIVSFSYFMKQKMLRHIRDAEIESKIRVCRSVLTIDPLQQRERPTPDRQTGKYIVLTVSRILEKKGFPRMARIMAAVISKDPRVHWNIVGSGPYEAHLRSSLLALSISDNVTFSGHVQDKAQLSQHYESADVFMLLSDYEEGLGLVYLEAASHGLPAIANDKSGERESVSHGISGFLINRDDEAVDIILNRRAERLRNSQSIREFASTFDVKHLPGCLLS